MGSRDMKLSRRSLLKGTAAASAAGAVAATAGDAEALRLLRPPEGLPAEHRVPSFCELCFWNCGLHAHVRHNRVLYLTGHPDHPGAMGRLCGRGNAGAASVTDPDRLRFPQLRTGKRGEGKFERVGWNTAYDYIAERMKRIKKEHGARALALFYHGKGGAMFRTMMAAYGSPNFAAAAYAQCKGPRDVGYKLTAGFTLPSPEPLDLDHTRCVVLFGSHLGENAHNSQVQQLVQAQARGAKLVVLDPRMSTVASRADVWLPVRPGSDTAVLLAWMHLLVKNGTYHRTFVDLQCTGFDELARHVAPFSPRWAAAEAGVDARQVVRAYEHMVEAMPAVVVHPGRHTTWYGEVDTQRARAQAMLSALLGAIWARGGIFRPARAELPPYPGPDFPDLPDNVDRAAGRFPFEKEVTTTGIRDATLTGKPYPIKGWLVYATNLLQNMPDPRRTRAAIDRLDLMVVTDIQPTEVTRHADVLLPEDTYLERHDDLSVGTGMRPFIALRQPAVTSPHDTRPAWRIARDLARKIGVGDFFAFNTFEEYLTKRLEGSGTTLEQLSRDGIYFPKVKVEPYLDPEEPHRWHTPSGKVELYSKQLADRGFSPLPFHTPQPAPPSGWFRLLYGRSPLHTFGRTANNPILGDVDPSNCLWLSPRSARQMRVEHAQPVMVRNRRGWETGPLRARVTERMPDDAVYMIHGFGHHAPDLTLTHGQGGSDTAVMDTYAVDPISGSTGMRVQFVTLRPATPEEELEPCG